MSSGVKHTLAILASGGGSNADKICSYFQQHSEIRVGLIISNQSAAGVVQVAARHNIPCVIIPKSEWSNNEKIMTTLDNYHITHLILAGFLLLVPDWLIRHFPHHIVNIHPALLPNYGGKGMYGHHVHHAVKSSGDLFTGITIHEVNEQYDDGRILFQEQIEIALEDTPEDIGAKVLRVEHRYYAPVIAKWITGEAITRELV